MAPEALTSVNFLPLLSLRLRILFFISYAFSEEHCSKTTNTRILLPINIFRIVIKHRQVALIPSAAK